MWIMAGSVTTEEKVEQLKQDTEVQKALDQAATHKEAVNYPRGKQRRLSQISATAPQVSLLEFPKTCS